MCTQAFLTPPTPVHMCVCVSASGHIYPHFTQRVGDNCFRTFLKIEPHIFSDINNLQNILKFSLRSTVAWKTAGTSAQEKFCKLRGAGAVEMAWQLRVLAALPEDWDSIPSTYTTAQTIYNSSPRAIWHPHTGTHAGETPVHIKINHKKINKQTNPKQTYKCTL